MKSTRRPNQKQRKFCKLYVSGLTMEEAYSQVYGAKDGNNARASASRMLKGKEVKEEIKRLQAINAKIVDKATDKATDKVAEKYANEIADKAERMAHLTKIMRGQVKVRVNKLFYDSKLGAVITQEVEELPDAMAQIKAISELNKMDGSYEVTKVDITSGGKMLPKLIVPGIKIAEDNGDNGSAGN